jgi:undecaprenyl-diphosphatase
VLVEVKRRILLVAAAASLGSFLLLAIIAARHHLFDVDRGAQIFAGLSHDPLLDFLMVALSALGYGSGLVPLIALGSLLLWEPRRRWAVALPLLMAGTGVLQLLAKWAVNRPRPNLAEWGFPSGHVLSVVVFFGLVAYLVHRSRAQRWRRRLAAALCALMVLGVAISRLYLGVHWLSDLAGGFALGLAYLFLVIWLVESLFVEASPETGLPAVAEPAEPMAPVVALAEPAAVS